MTDTPTTPPATSDHGASAGLPVAGTSPRRPLSGSVAGGFSDTARSRSALLRKWVARRLRLIACLVEPTPRPSDAIISEADQSIEDITVRCMRIEIEEYDRQSTYPFRMEDPLIEAWEQLQFRHRVPKPLPELTWRDVSRICIPGWIIGRRMNDVAGRLLLMGPDLCQWLEPLLERLDDTVDLSPTQRLQRALGSVEIHRELISAAHA